VQNKIEIDKDCFDFLLYSYFGGDKNPYAAASKRAYRDLCRTLRFHGRSGIEYRKYIDGLLEKRIRCLIDEGCFSQEQYDEKHQGLCQDMIEYYRGKGINFNIGHAQKWINMTMKYLYIYGGVDISGLFCFFHIPVDQYVFKAVKNKLSIRRPCDAWSKINDYAVYIEYQKKIRSELDVAPLRWEFSHWIEEAVRRKKYED
jgi:hypothetical protein